MCEDIQADVEDGQLQIFYILAFILQGDVFARPGRFAQLISVRVSCLLLNIQVFAEFELNPPQLQFPASFLSGFWRF